MRPALLWTVLLLLLGAPAIAEAPDNIRVVLNGQTLKLDVPPVMHQGTVYVPLRGIFEKMGAQVKYDAGTGLVTATRSEIVVELKVGDTLAHVNGESVVMIQPAGMIKNRTMVPLRFLTEALRLEVDWDPSTATVTISGH